MFVHACATLSYSRASANCLTFFTQLLRSGEKLKTGVGVVCTARRMTRTKKKEFKRARDHAARKLSMAEEKEKVKRASEQISKHPVCAFRVRSGCLRCTGASCDRRYGRGAAATSAQSRCTTKNEQQTQEIAQKRETAALASLPLVPRGARRAPPVPQCRLLTPGTWYRS